MKFRLPLAGQVLFFRGATCWEGQVGPYWFSLSYPRYWLTGPLSEIFHCGKELL